MPICSTYRPSEETSIRVPPNKLFFFFTLFVALVPIFVRIVVSVRIRLFQVLKAKRIELDKIHLLARTHIGLQQKQWMISQQQD